MSHVKPVRPHRYLTERSNWKLSFAFRESSPLPAEFLPLSPTIGPPQTLPPATISGSSEECDGRPRGAGRTSSSIRGTSGQRIHECCLAIGQIQQYKVMSSCGSLTSAG